MTYEKSCRRSGYRTRKKRAAGLPPPLGFSRSSRAAYWHFGSPSLFAGANARSEERRVGEVGVFRCLLFAFKTTAVVVNAGVVVAVGSRDVVPLGPYPDV